MSDPASVRPVLLQFVEHLSLPQELSRQCHQLFEPTAEAGGGRSEGDLLDAIADRVSQYISLSRQQRTEALATLLSLNGRISGVASSLEHVTAVASQAFEANQEFNAMIQAEVAGLDLSLQEVEDTTSVKRVVSIAARSITSYLDDKTSFDADRRAQFERDLSTIRVATSQMEGKLVEQCQKATHSGALEMRDPLTGCYNRMAYLDHAARAHACWRQSGDALSLVFLGIDHLNQVNEQFGHKAGDQVLRVIAKLAQEELKDRGTLFRNGGGEFVCLLRGASASRAFQLAEQLRQQVLGFRFHSKGEKIDISLSCGVAQLTTDDDMDGVFERAYGALRAARTGTGNRTVCANETGPDPANRL